MPKTKDNTVVTSSENLYKGRVGLVYARVSDMSQETHGSGGTSQETRCKKDLEALGVHHEKSFIDTYTGAGDFMKRPAMRALLAYIDAHPHKDFLVVFDDLSRLARDVEFHIKLRYEFKIRGVMLRCLNYKLDETEEGEFIELIMAGKAQLDRKQNRRQVIQKMKARLDSGYWPFAQKRGYDFVRMPGQGKVGVPNEKGWKIIKPALEGFANGTLPRKVDVAQFLLENGLWKNRLRLRCLDDVSDMLQDCYYCGDIEYTPWDVPRAQGHHEGVISRETFAHIQKRLSKNNADAKPRKDTSEDFPMRGLLLCDPCGSHLTGAYSRGRSNTYPYYFCQNPHCGLYHKSLRKKDVEDDFKSLLERNKLKPEVDDLISVVFDKVWAQEAEAVKWHDYLTEQKKIELQKKLSDLAELARKASSDIVRRTYETQIEEAGTGLERIEQTVPVTRDLGVPYRTALDKTTALLKNPVSAWDLFDVHEQHRLFFFLFEGKLAYTKNEGYRTGNSLSTTRLFEELATADSADVDLRGVEPLTSAMRMQRSTS